MFCLFRECSVQVALHSMTLPPCFFPFVVDLAGADAHYSFCFVLPRSLAGEPAAGALLKACNGSYIGMIVLSGSSVMIGSLFMLGTRLRINPKLLARV